jgi:hypothetical protein
MGKIWGKFPKKKTDHSDNQRNRHFSRGTTRTSKSCFSHVFQYPKSANFQSFIIFIDKPKIKKNRID